jgi:hypothetical protein
LTVHHQRFSIYSTDPDIAFPLVELSFKRQDIIKGIKAKSFNPADVGPLVKRFADAIQEAIKEGQSK